MQQKQNTFKTRPADKNIPSPTCRCTRESSNPTAKSGKNFLETCIMTIIFFSQYGSSYMNDQNMVLLTSITI